MYNNIQKKKRHKDIKEYSKQMKYNQKTEENEKNIVKGNTCMDDQHSMLQNEFLDRKSINNAEISINGITVAMIA